MNIQKKLVELLGTVSCNGNGESLGSCPDRKYGICGEVANLSYCVIQNIANHLVVNGVTVQEWTPVSDPPKEPGEYIVARKHWLDGHLEIKEGKWNGVDWFIAGRESLMVAYWMPTLPLPEPPKEEA